MVKNIFLISIIILLAAVGFLLLRRPPTPPPPPEAGMHPRPGAPENLKTRQGLVLGYQYNAHLDVNAIQLKTLKEGVITIDFRPHTAKTVMDHAAIGDSIEVVTGSHPND